MDHTLKYFKKNIEVPDKSRDLIQYWNGEGLSKHVTATEAINKRINKFGGFPGGTVIENLSANAGDTSSSPGLGRSHMPWSNWAQEPQLLSLRVWSLCSTTREAAIVRGPRTAMKSGPRSPQVEKALAQKRRPSTVINKDKSINQKKNKFGHLFGKNKFIQKTS